MTRTERFLVTIAAIVKNEADYIVEWIEYHALIGVEHFYIYDNGSDDDLAAVLRPYILDGRLTLLCWPEFPGQMSAYNHAVKIFGRDSRWMALIDIDEFLEVRSGEPLPQALDRHGADADQILLPWIQYGSSGHIARPAGLVIESYVHRMEEAHRQPKTVVRPGAVRWAGVHHCETVSGRTINGLGERVPERWILAQPVDGPLRVNHYFTKSRDEFAAKIGRGQVDGGRGKTLEDFNRFQTDVHDPGMAKWVEPVKRALAAAAGVSGQPANHAPRSAQSELTPSRSWNLAANEAMALVDKQLQAAGVPIGARNASLDHVMLCAQDVPPAVVADAARALGAKIGATPIGRTASGIAPGTALELSLGSEPMGRPYAVCRIASDAAATLLLRVEGEDPAPKPWSNERRIALSPGVTFLALVLSPRVMKADRASFSLEGAAGEIDLSVDIFVSV